MRYGDDQAQQNGMARGSLGTDKVSGDDCLAVAGLQRMQASQADGNECRGKQEPDAQMLGCE